MVSLQSLQVASFMLTVCNVVIVALDWFADLNFLRYSMFIFDIITKGQKGFQDLCIEMNATLSKTIQSNYSLKKSITNVASVD